MSLLVRNTSPLVGGLLGEPKSRAMRAYAQSGQYHTIVESRDS